MSEKPPKSYTDSEEATRKKNTVALCLLIPTEIIFIVLSMYLEFDNQDLAYGFIALQEFFYTGAMIILIVVGTCSMIKDLDCCWVIAANCYGAQSGSTSSS